MTKKKKNRMIVLIVLGAILHISMAILYVCLEERRNTIVIPEEQTDFLFKQTIDEPSTTFYDNDSI